jgi:hypothetical protein
MNDPIRDHWRVHPFEGTHPIAMRALKPAGSTQNLYPVNKLYRPVDFESSEALMQQFERDALELSHRGYNVYTVMNVIREDLPANRAVGDADIVARRLLLIDIDRVGDTKNPATNEEVAGAFDLANSVATYLHDQGFPKPLWVHSGNGAHLYYRIQPFQPFDEALIGTSVSALLKGIAKRFNNEIVGVDTSVSNPSRITKVIGTLARKGVESEGRPFRVAKLI